MAEPGTSSRKVDNSFASRAAAGRVDRLWRRDPVAAAALGVVAEARGLAIGDLLQPNRGAAKIAFARQLAMYLVHILLGRTLTEVGEVFGRDRTTVAHACALIEDQRESRTFDAAVERLETIIQQRCAAAPMGADRAAV